MLTDIANRYKYSCVIDIYSISENKPLKIRGTSLNWIKVKPWKGFFPFNLWIICILPIIHRLVSKKYNWKHYDFVFFSHDHYTKSPYLIRYIKGVKKYYLCQESQREFYEPIKYHTEGTKDKITTFLRFPIKLIDRKNTSYVTKLFCNSKYSKATLEKIYKKECEIVYPGVNEKFFYPSKQKKENLILCVGGINKTKNQEFLVNVLTPILDKYKLILVGQGRKSFINKIKKINPNVEIYSNITDTDLRELYRKAMVTCISAYKEPFGLSSIESQSCGTPVVAVRGGGTEETILNGINGYVVNLSQNEYLEKVKKTLTHSHSMGKKARDNVTNKWTNNITLKTLDKYFLK